MKNRYSDYIDKMPEKGCAIVKDTRFTKPYLIVTYPFQAEDISTDEVNEIMHPYLAHIHTKLQETEDEALKKAREIIREINKKNSPDAAQQKELIERMLPHTRRLLKLISRNLFAPKTELESIALTHSIKNKEFNQSLGWLESKGIIKEIKITLKTTPSKFYPLTKLGYDLIKTPKKDRVYDRTFKHTFICIKIEQYLQRKGHETVREYMQGLDKNSRIDVMAKKDNVHIAYEYINTGFKYMAGTIFKCLIQMQMHALVIICDNQKAIAKAQEKAESDNTLDKWADQIKGKITYKTVKDFI